MSQSQISYTDKVENGGVTAEGLVAASDLNDVKNTVNSNASDVTARVGDLEVFAAERKSFELVTESQAVTASAIAADPTAGDITITMPDANLVPNQYITIKRVTNGDNMVEVASNDLIDGFSESVVLGHVNESLTLYSDGVGFLIFNRATEAFSSIATDQADTFAITSTPQKLTTWDTNTYSTSGRMLADEANNRINVIKHSGAVQDGYKANCDIVVEFNKDKYIVAQFYVDGSPVAQKFAVNGLGAGKPLTISMLAAFGLTSAASVEVWISAESAGTLTVLDASFTIESILG